MDEQSTVKICPICGEAFTPRRPWHEYDKPECRMKAFQIRKAQELIAEVGKIYTERLAKK